jgi:hypothetical protein
MNTNICTLTYTRFKEMVSRALTIVPKIEPRANLKRVSLWVSGSALYVGGTDGYRAVVSVEGVDAGDHEPISISGQYLKYQMAEIAKADSATLSLIDGKLRIDTTPLPGEDARHRNWSQAMELGERWDGVKWLYEKQIMPRNAAEFDAPYCRKAMKDWPMVERQKSKGQEMAPLLVRYSPQSVSIRAMVGAEEFPRHVLCVNPLMDDSVTMVNAKWFYDALRMFAGNAYIGTSREHLFLADAPTVQNESLRVIISALKGTR